MLVSILVKTLQAFEAERNYILIHHILVVAYGFQISTFPDFQIVRFPNYQIFEFLDVPNVPFQDVQISRYPDAATARIPGNKSLNPNPTPLLCDTDFNFNNL